jgi:hypothetical protein
VFIKISCVAQDTIVKRDGQLLIGTVLEVSTEEVKYKKIDFPDGPTYIQIKSTIERINYHGGHVDIFKEEEKISKENASKSADYVEFENGTPIIKMDSYYRRGPDVMTERDVHKLLLSTKDPEIMSCVKNAKTSKALRYLGFAAIPLIVSSIAVLSICSDVEQLSNSESNAYLSASAGLAICSAGVYGTSIYFNINRKVKNRQAIKLYNDKYANHPVKFDK